MAFWKVKASKNSIIGLVDLQWIEKIKIEHPWII
jgi:hypothetical protein